MLLGLDELPLKPGAAAPEAAIGDYPERSWEKHGGDDPKRLDIVAPITVNGRLEAKGDVDRFQLPVSPGQKYRFTVQASFAPARTFDGVLADHGSVGQATCTGRRRDGDRHRVTGTAAVHKPGPVSRRNSSGRRITPGSGAARPTPSRRNQLCLSLHG